MGKMWPQPKHPFHATGTEKDLHNILFFGSSSQVEHFYITLHQIWWKNVSTYLLGKIKSQGRPQKTSYGRTHMFLYVTQRDVPYRRP